MTECLEIMGEFQRSAPKKATNLSVNSQLLRAAKERKINLSATLEEALIEKLRAQAESEWLAENDRALSEYAEHVDARGVFGDGLRRF